MSEEVDLVVSFSMNSLRTALTRRPLLWFFTLTLVPAALSQVAGLDFALAVAVYLFTAGPIAVLLCWAGDSNPRLARRPGLRLLVFIAVTIVMTLAIGYFTGSGSLLLDLAVAAFYGYTICCLWSPVPAVRDLVRPLVAWRLPWRRYAFALLVWPALALVVVAAARLLALRDHSAVAALPPSLTQRADLILRASVGELLLLVPWIVGWYGFAARRLLARYSPLAVALLLGTLLTIVFLLLDLQFLGFQASDVAHDLAGSLPLAVVSLWLYERSPRSLLPLVLLQAAAPVGALVVLFWAGPWFGHIATAQTAFQLSECLLAAVLVVAYRMWRGPKRETPIPALDAVL